MKFTVKRLIKPLRMRERDNIRPMIACIMNARAWRYGCKGLQIRYMGDEGGENFWTTSGAWPITPQYRLRKKRIDPHCLKPRRDQNRRRSSSNVST